METNTQEGTSLDNMLDEFNFAIDEAGNVLPEDDTSKGTGEPSEEEKAAQAAAEEEAKKKAEEEAAKEGADDEEAAKKKAEEEAAAKAAADDDKNKAPTGQSDSFYAQLAKKYIEKGRWSKEMAIEDEEGNQIPLTEVADLNEETFFQIEEALRAEEEEARKQSSISIDGLDDRRKTLIEIVQNGGDLANIFQNEKQVEQYLNPFGDLDLDDENTQANVYMKALVQFKGLDQESAAVLVQKAKDDFTLDDKAKTFVSNYTKKFDDWVASKKDEILEQQKQEKQQLAELKKTLAEEYKGYGLKDSLVRKLTSSAINKTEEGYEIDQVYNQKMEDPKEAAELVLFLQDKEAYLEYKMKQTKVDEKRNTLKVFKLAAGSQTTKKPGAGVVQGDEEDEFNFKVDVPN